MHVAARESLQGQRAQVGEIQIRDEESRARRFALVPAPRALHRADPRIVAVRQIAVEVARDQTQAVEVADRDGRLRAYADRTQILVPQHRTQFQRKHRFAGEQGRVSARAPAHEQLVDCNVVAALVEVVGTVLSVVVARCRELDRRTDFQFRDRIVEHAEAAAAKHALDIRLVDARNVAHPILAQQHVAEPRPRGRRLFRRRQHERLVRQCRCGRQQGDQATKNPRCAHGLPGRMASMGEFTLKIHHKPMKNQPRSCTKACANSAAEAKRSCGRRFRQRRMMASIGGGISAQ